MTLLRRQTVDFADGPALTPFSRLRVANPETIFDANFGYGKRAILFNEILAGTGSATHLPNQSSVALACATSGDAAALQSKMYHRYVPGKGQLIKMAQVYGAASVGVVKRAGYFDANDGVFLEQNGTTDVAFVRRTSTSGSPVDNRVVQASWNLDPLDGTGPSGITLDLSLDSILILDLQWLSMGRIRVGFDIGGLIVYCHEFLHANILSVPYMRTANLPIRWSISSTSAAGSFQVTCCAVESEGGAEFARGLHFAVDTVGTVRTIGATALPVMSLRPRTTFGGLTNRIQMVLEGFNWLATNGTNSFRWRLIYGGVTTGGSWANVDASNSGMEYNVTGTAFTGGIAVNSGYDNASSAQRFSNLIETRDNRYPWCLDGAGNQIEMILSMLDVSGGTTDVLAAMQWKELR
jgi:hypothetical protein